MRRAPNSTNAASSKSSNRQIPELPGFHWVGWVKDAHALKGEIYVQLKSKTADWLDDVESLLLWSNLTNPAGETQTFEIARAVPYKDGLRVKFSGVDDRNQSEALRKWQVYIPDEALVADEGEQLFLKEILKFVVKDPSGKKLGVVAGFATNSAQDLLELQTESGEVHLVPFVDEFIVELDQEKGEIVMDLPPGLLDTE